MIFISDNKLSKTNIKREAIIIQDGFQIDSIRLIKNKINHTHLKRDKTNTFSSMEKKIMVAKRLRKQTSEKRLIETRARERERGEINVTP